jgi:hypothetical protein
MNSSNQNIEKLLKEAGAILYENIDQESALLEKDPWANVPSEKYERAKILFEKVLSVDPTNKRAQDGLNVCLEMIQPYVPVQYMVPPPSTDDIIELLQPISEKTVPSNQKIPLKPWELRRSQRSRDKRGLEYTSQKFGEASVEAKEEISKILDGAKAEFLKDERDPREIFNETAKSIMEFQEILHRRWKGHGPEVSEEALKRLKDVLGLKKT